MSPGLKIVTRSGTSVGWFVDDEEEEEEEEVNGRPMTWEIHSTTLGEYSSYICAGERVLLGRGLLL
jgi:hypothetical protein